MKLKPTNPSEVLGFIKAMLFLGLEINQDLEAKIAVSETDTMFIVDCKYIAELNNHGEAIWKEADMSFSWLKSESLDKLNKYIADLENELTSVELNYNGYK
jgi:hypothetical protein